MGRLLLRGIAVLFGLLLAVSVAAQEENRWYQVELLIFSQGEGYLDAEVWPLNPELPETTGATDLRPVGQTAPGAEAFQALPPEDLQLSDEHAHLRRSSALEPLLLTGWRQPGLPREQAVKVHIRDDAGRVEGTVTLILSRYLHIAADLAYRLPGGPPLPDMAADPAEETVPAAPVEFPAFPDDQPVLSEEPTVFVLEQSRRMRSGELHYLDHPLFGMLVKVIPYERPQAAVEPAASEAAAAVGQQTRP